MERENVTIYHVSRNPTPQQEEAIAALIKATDQDVLAWIKYSRGILSSSQRDALKILKDCNDSQIITWLRQARPTVSQIDEADAHANPIVEFATSLTHLKRLDAAVGAKRLRPPVLEPKSLEALEQVNQAYKYEVTPRSLQSTSRKVSNSAHQYWCTRTECEDYPHSYRTSDGFKKHEKELQFHYRCLPNGVLDASKNCVICQASGPDDEHFVQHNLRTCIQGYRVFKRRYEMSRHIEQEHGACNGETLAGTWLQQSSKQAWSCGFCVCYFPTLTERLKHICLEHYEKGQRLDGWQQTNVIRGLLLQPAGVLEAWQQLVMGLDPCFRNDFSWTSDTSQNLQFQLETGPTSQFSANALAKAAYEASNYSWALPTSDLNSDGNAMATTTAPSNFYFSLAQPVDVSELASQAFYSETFWNTNDGDNAPLYPSL